LFTRCLARHWQSFANTAALDDRRCIMSKQYLDEILVVNDDDENQIDAKNDVDL
jgi:hypothetical protein